MVFIYFSKHKFYTNTFYQLLSQFKFCYNSSSVCSTSDTVEIVALSDDQPIHVEQGNYWRWLRSLPSAFHVLLSDNLIWVYAHISSCQVEWRGGGSETCHCTLANSALLVLPAHLKRACVLFCFVFEIGHLQHANDFHDTLLWQPQKLSFDINLLEPGATFFINLSREWNRPPVTSQSINHMKVKQSTVYIIFIAYFMD